MRSFPPTMVMTALTATPAPPVHTARRATAQYSITTRPPSGSIARAVVFRLRAATLECLLVETDGQWDLPGEICDGNECAPDAAARAVERQTDIPREYVTFAEDFGVHAPNA